MKSLILYARLLVSLLGLNEDDALACWESPSTWREIEPYRLACRIDLASDADHPALILAQGWNGEYIVDVFAESALED